MCLIIKHIRKAEVPVVISGYNKNSVNLTSLISFVWHYNLC